MKVEILTLQRDLLLEELMEVEEKLNNNGIKRNKKGYTLFLRNGVYYVKYTDLQTGKQIPTNKTLQTTDRNEAETLAIKYRDSILRSYYDKKNKIKDIVKFFSEYYKLEKSTYLQELLKNGERKIGKPIIRHYDGFINKYFVEFLKKYKIKRINEITLEKLKAFQTYLVENKLNPKTINTNINGAIKPIFTNLLLKGIIKQTPFTKNADYRFNLPESEKRKRIHTLPIYDSLLVLIDQEIWKLYKTREDIAKGIITNPNHYKKYRLLCLLMATCGLRNAEIFMLKKENIKKIRRTDFIEVVNSRIEEEGVKTVNSYRKVPIPAITLQALNEYIQENNITEYLFYSGSKTIHYNMFGFAKNQFGAHCGYTEKEMEEKNIDFYSFRHLYKTILERSAIKKDIIEYFMGHSVNVNRMDERYNNREDLDDIFFEEYGIKVNEYINELCNKVEEKYSLMVIHKHIEEIILTDNKKKVKTFFTEVINDIDFENETYFNLCDLQEKNSLPNTDNKKELIQGLNVLLEKGAIDKRLYDDYVYYLKINEKNN
jgi:integrase